jgi:hypothetical protein
LPIFVVEACDTNAQWACDAGDLVCHPNACEAVPPFTDNFFYEGPGLRAPWEAPPVGTSAFVVDRQLCGTTQSVALFCTHLPSIYIQFDWWATTIDGFEVAAIVSQTDGSIITAYDLGMSGGSVPQMLQAVQVSPVFGVPLQDSEPIDATFQIRTFYRFSATISSADHTFSVSVGDTTGNVFTSMSGSLPEDFVFDHVGILTGRDPNGKTCIDNFVFREA